MSTSAAKPNSSVVALDQLFLEIIRDLLEDTIHNASEAARQILNMSGQFLNESAQNALRDFHSLYFSGSTELDSEKDRVNADIDTMFDTIAANLQQGASTEEIRQMIHEDADAKKARLSLSGLQKQLEGIVSLDKGIRERLVPVLGTMQFEDHITQRIRHVIRSWELVIKRLDHSDVMDTLATGEEIASILTSQAELQSFYKLVLKRDAPEGMPSESELWFAV